jgi:two-component system sensor histidine kinase AlgZ
MKDSQLLSMQQESLLQDLPGGRTLPPQRQGVLVFDACHVGVILRAVLFVEAVMAVGVMFIAPDFPAWLLRLSLLSGASLPATLAWLIAACSLKRVLARLTPAGQYLAGAGLGALAGLYGCAQGSLFGMGANAPWLASAFSGALLASALVAALVWRAKARTPADTTARLAELQARIRPHFLFNTLNSAVALVRQDPARAEAILEDLADLFRHALIDQGESVTLAQEVALAHRYLDIEQVRFGDRLRMEWDIDPAAGTARLPPLLLQPLVENAVKHGVEPSDEGAQVRVSTQRRGSTVVIKVTNTVPAGQGQPGHGLALQNVRERLGLLHDVEGQFNCGLHDGVFQVRIEVPA